jgi:hypothetical protein
MIAIESGGNVNAYNEAEEAAGCLQIRPCYLQDVNRILGEDKYCLADRFDEYKSRQMVLTYWVHYATEERIGRAPTLADLARIHNGGPNGYKKDSTEIYWLKVKSEYDKLSKEQRK